MFPHHRFRTLLVAIPRSWIVLFLVLATEIAAMCLAEVPAAKAAKPATPPRTISFQRINTAQNASLQLIREDGAGEVAVNSGKGIWRNTWARWSPNGAMLGGYFKNLRADFGIMAMKSDGTQERVVVSASEFDALNLARPGVLSSSLLTSRSNYPAWLGNGAMIFAASTSYDPSFFGTTDPSYASRGDRLFITDSAGTIWPLTEAPLQNAGPAANGNYYDADPHWSAVLDAVVFVSNRSGFDELYAIRPDGSGLTQITDFRLRFETQTKVLFTPVWSPLGDRLALSVNFDDGGNPRDLVILDIDLTQPAPGLGAGGRVLGMDPFKVAVDRQENSPSWSPTGDRLLFHSYYYSSRFSQIVVANVTTGAENVLVETRINDGSLVPDVLLPDWKPVP